jgi:chitodextrinase
MRRTFTLLFVSFVFVAVVGTVQAQTGPSIAGCPIFPPDNVWNTPIDQLPVDPNSSAYISSIGAGTGFHPDFGSGTWDGAPIGIPYNVVPGTQPKVPVEFGYADESDPGPYPIPPGAEIEGGYASDGDRHVLVIDSDNCVLYETWSSYPNPDGSWSAGSGAVFNLLSHELRPDGWTSSDAAGLPILPGLIRYDEVASGEIRHAIRFTAPRTRRVYVWPARHYASSYTTPAYPPMGQRFRLKAGFDVSGFSPEVQVILRAMKLYGIILADNGSAWYVQGVPDPRWDNDMLVGELRRVTGSNFEAIDASSLMIDPDSGQARQDHSDTDTEPPSAPANLKAAAVSSSRIDLSWGGSTDNVDVAGYIIYRNGTQAATATGTSFSDSGLRPSTAYTYRVAAYDAQNNVSDQSNSASATTWPAPDTEPPTIPANVAAAVISSFQINLSWNASSDNVGVTGYRVYRCQGSGCSPSVMIGASGTASYQDKALKPSTVYVYRIAAEDAAGNVSGKSAAVSGQTQPLPSTVFAIGNRVRTTRRADIRAAASTSGTLLGTQPKGAPGMVVGEPWYANSSWWWQVNFDSGVDGWVKQGYLRK